MTSTRSRDTGDSMRAIHSATWCKNASKNILFDDIAFDPKREICIVERTLCIARTLPLYKPKFFMYALNFAEGVHIMADHIWCDPWYIGSKKWVTKRLLTDKMIRTQYGVQTRIPYTIARTACAGPPVLFIVTI